MTSKPGELRLRLVAPDSRQGDHFERCPFWGGMFDMRDLDQGLEYYGHQLAAGAR